MGHPNEAEGITRRAAAATAAGVMGASPASAQTRATFVLVHGAWHGGWCYRRVADLLQPGAIPCSPLR
jgi:hypothetical protein